MATILIVDDHPNNRSFLLALLASAGYQLLESAVPGAPFVQLGDDIVGESISISVPLHLRAEASYVLGACNAAGCTSSEALRLAGSLAEAVGYRNSQGEYWTSTVGDILTHVALHGAYHRAQIATAIREAGGTPAYTDFIHATRQGLVE